jgi:hypothetical protein
LIKGICCDENLVHNRFLQTNMTIFLQNERYIYLNFLMNKDCFRILFLTFKFQNYEKSLQR